MLVKRTIRNTEQTYEYKGKEKKYDGYIQLRVEKETIGKLKSLSKHLEYTDYAKLTRDIIDKYLDKFEFIEDTSLEDKDKCYIVKIVKVGE